MKEGKLYLLQPMADQFPHIQELFPYMKGGKVLTIRTQSTTVKSKTKKYQIQTVDFLFDGKVYTESVSNFEKFAIYISDVTQ
jgi:hypothetical protein